MLENQCNHSDTCGWKVRSMFFNGMGTQVLLYGVNIWGGTIPLNAWDEIEIQKMLQRTQLGEKSTTFCTVMLLETDVRPIEVSALQIVYRYIIKVKNMPNHRLPHLAWIVECSLEKNHKQNYLIWFGIWHQKWFKRWSGEISSSFQRMLCNM